MRWWALAAWAWGGAAWAAPTVNVDALLGGAAVTVEVTGVPAGAEVILFGGRGTGARYCPAILPNCTDLDGPGQQLGRGFADGGGVYRVAVTAPRGAVGVQLQAFARAGGVGRKSPVVSAVVLGQNGDFDVDGLSNADELLIFGTHPLLSDTDGGGLNDGDEFLNGRDPFNPADDYLGGGGDSDGDGLSDWDEQNVYGTDPYNADPDGDTVPDGEELSYGTDPWNWDTDGGGVSDGEEIYWQGTDPLYWYDDIDPWSRDSDGDGLYDGEETGIWGSDPWSYDTDGGGVGDGEEVSQGTSPTNSSDDYPWLDSDNDGLPDQDEWMYGTDPYNYDTDGGGVSDGNEVNNGTNPLDPYDG